MYRYSSIDMTYILFFQTHIDIHMKYAVHVSDLFIPVIGLKMLRFTFSVSFGTHASLDKPLIVLQLQAHLSNLTKTG